MDYTLCVTRRALEDDLGLVTSFEGWDAGDIIQDVTQTFIRRQPTDVPNDEAARRARARVRRDYGPLCKFVELRRHRATGQEPTQNLPLHPGATWNIHAGPDRGVSWFDEPGQVVWLCAAGFHRSGQRDDFYPRVVALDAADQLLPNPEEIAAGRARALPDPLSDIDAHLPVMLHQARDQPGNEISRRFERLVGASVFVDVYTDTSGGLEEVSVGIVVVNPNDSPADVDLVTYCLTVLFPDAAASDYEFIGRFPHRPRRAGERIVRICRDI